MYRRAGLFRLMSLVLIGSIIFTTVISSASRVDAQGDVTLRGIVIAAPSSCFDFMLNNNVGIDVTSPASVIGSISVGDEVEVLGEDVSARIFIPPYCCGDFAPCTIIHAYESHHYIKKIGGGAANLIITAVGFDRPEPFQEGDTIHFRTAVTNQGDGAANNFDLEIYLDGQLFDYGPVSLGAHQSYTWTFSVPWTATRGSHTIEAVADNSVRKSRSFTVGGTQRYPLATYVSPSGSGSVSPSGGTYDQGTSVTLNAYSNSGWRFDHWGGDASGYSTSTSIYMDSDKIVTAYFVKEIQRYTLSTYINPSGAGSISLNPSGGTYNSGTTVTVTANRNSGWIFNRWGGAATGSSTSTTVYMNSDKSVTAYFEKSAPEKYKLTIQTNGCGDTTPGVGTNYYDKGKLVPMHADPCPGWKFVRWSGVDSPDDTWATVTMNSDKNVTAYFEEETKKPLDTDISIQLSPTKVTKGEQTKVLVSGKLVASESGKGINSSNIEVRWGTIGKTNVVTDASGNFSLIVNLTATENLVFQATFWGNSTYAKSEDSALLTTNGESKKHKLTIEAGQGGTTIPSPGVYEYTEGTTKRIWADPNEGWEFNQWGGNADGSNSYIDIRMDSDKRVVAYFISTSQEHAIHVTGGIQDYTEVTAFFRGSSMHVKLDSLEKMNRDFELLHWLDVNENLSVDEEDSDLWVSRYTFSSHDTELDQQLPQDLPIGLYKLLVRGTTLDSDLFFIIFNPVGSEQEKFWKSEVTGYLSNRIWEYTPIKTSHHSSDIMICMASASSGGNTPYLPTNERQAMVHFQDWLNEVITKKKMDPPSDIEDLIRKVKFGNIEGDCATFSPFLVTLARAAGITAREITGKAFPFWAHNWVEAYFDGGWQVWDPTYNRSFGTGYKQFSKFHGVQSWRWHYFSAGVEDELGQVRTSDY